MHIKASDIFNKGYMTTEMIMSQGIPFNRIDEWLSTGQIEKVDRGVYCLPGTKMDELALIQYRYDKCIFSGITALSLHGLTDHISEYLHVTLPQGYNPSSLKDSLKISVTRSVPKIYDLGRTTVETEYGNMVNVYDEERSLCDVLRGKGMSPFIVKTAMKRYLTSPKRDTDLLLQYAETLHVTDKVANYIDVF